MTRKRVLIVDDHGGFRATARRLLESEGWTVVGEAADGRSAMAAAANLRPDLVLLDIGLPDVTGFDIVEPLMSICPAEVVLVSSRDRSAYSDRLAQSAAVGFIAKEDLDGLHLRSLLSSAGDWRPTL